MFSCLAWTSGLLAAWCAVMVWHLQGGAPPALVNGLAYAGLGALAMALIGRCATTWHPALQRVSGLLFCAILAGIDVSVSGTGGEAGQKLFFAALLGIAAVVLAARHAPAAVRRRWLGEKAD